MPKEVDRPGHVDDPNQLVQELAFDSYLPSGPELENITESAHSALTTMVQDPSNYRAHVEKARQFLKALWTKYDCDDVIEVFEAFTKIEPVLVDLEGSKGFGFRYRDHSVHTFHVFTLGLRIITKLAKELGDTKAQEVLKVKPETIREFLPGFRDYGYRERLFYLWSLISTFHDIAVPLENLDMIRGGLNEFSRHFDLKIVGPYLERDALFDIHEYLGLLGRLFQGEVRLDEQGRCYKQDKENPYFKRFLARELAKDNHGVLGGLLMFKVVEKTFLLGLSKKHVLDSEALFDNYVRYVLSQDIARAALAISLHRLRPSEQGPLFLPIRFKKYPLAFILILSDEIQEYLRWAGPPVGGASRFTTIPDLQLKADSSTIELEVKYHLGTESAQVDSFIGQMKPLADALQDSQPQNVTDAAAIFCKALSRGLSGRILLDGEFTLMLTVMQNGSPLLTRKVS